MSDPDKAADARFDEWEALCEAATDGPWRHGDNSHVGWVMPEQFGEGRCYACNRGEPSWVGQRDINGTRMLAHVHRGDVWWPHGVYAVRPDGDLGVVNDTDEYGYMDDADAAFIATFDPDTVVALIQALRAIHDAHYEQQTGPDEFRCAECGQHYPCPTKTQLVYPAIGVSDE